MIKQVLGNILQFRHEINFSPKFRSNLYLINFFVISRKYHERIMIPKTLRKYYEYKRIWEYFDYFFAIWRKRMDEKMERKLRKKLKMIIDLMRIEDWAKRKWYCCFWMDQMDEDIRENAGRSNISVAWKSWAKSEKVFLVLIEKVCYMYILHVCICLCVCLSQWWSFEKRSCPEK